MKLIDTMKNKTIGPNEVLEKFGVGPKNVIDVQALAGDSSDNVPGAPGIGIKTAAQLINEFQSIENLLENYEEIKQQKRRESPCGNAPPDDGGLMLGRVFKTLRNIDAL